MSGFITISGEGGGPATSATLTNGTVSIPSLRFVADTNLGIYRIGADQLGISAGINGLGVEIGNFTTLNIDPTSPDIVRYTSRFYPQPISVDALESSSIYIRLDHSIDDQTYGAYFEVDADQSRVGGSATKVIHLGAGDAHYVALRNPVNVGSVGYEAATWSDGSTSFLASCQTSGVPNWVGFDFLYSQDNILNIGGFVGHDVPNNTFVTIKRTGMADVNIDGYAQYSIIESLYRMIDGYGGSTTSYKGDWSASTAYVIGDTIISGQSAYRCILGNTNNIPPNVIYWVDVTDTTNLGRARFSAYNSGEVQLQSLKSNSTNTLKDSPQLLLRGNYWTGSVGQDRDAIIKHVVSNTTPTSSLRFYIGDQGDSASLMAIISPNSVAGGDLDLQNGTLQSVHTITFKGADATNSIDLQTGSISNCASITGTVVNMQTSGTQFDHYVNGNVAIELLDTIADGETSLLIRRNVGGGYSLQRVSMGSDNSGGTGYKVLRVPN